MPRTCSSAAEPATIRDRQEAFAELAGRLDFRENLSRAGGDIGEGLDTDALASWAVTTEAVAVGPARAIGIVFSVATSLALLGLLLFDVDARLVLLAIALEFGFAWSMAKHVRRILDEADHRAEALEAIAAMLARIEHERFRSHLLSSIRDRLVVDGHAASSWISAASRLLDQLEWGRNMMFVPFALLFLWSTQVALSVELWRRRHGRDVRAWIDAVAEFEALASFAAYTFENPDQPFPRRLSRRE